jgi:uncharacterized protein YajQ (UPF0234 family)
MATECSFDIVSKIDLQEIDNAVNQVKKIIINRYDLKGTKCDVTFDKKTSQVQISAEDKMKYETLLGIVKERLAARNVSLKSLKLNTEQQALDGSIQQTVDFQNGIPSETAKEITKMIRDTKLKVQAQIQSDQIRVTGKSRDDLQQIIQILKEKDINIPLQFTNFR